MIYGEVGKLPLQVTVDKNMINYWLESVEVDMAELEIDKEDVHDRSKWRRIVNVMKRKSNPIGKWTINR